MKTSFVPGPVAVAGFSLFWFLAVMLGLGTVQRYENRAGQAAAAPALWPEKAALKHAQSGLTLLMAVHPQCPCSRASLAELAQLMARSQDRIHATVVFVQYPGVSAQWVQTGTWRQAQAIPGVQVVIDTNGALSHQLGAFTSGQTYLYDGQGRLLFSGGLTSERGHEGDNAGLSAALALLRGTTPTQTQTPVFGCPLFSQSRAEEKDLSRY